MADPIKGVVATVTPTEDTVQVVRKMGRTQRQKLDLTDGNVAAVIGLEMTQANYQTIKTMMVQVFALCEQDFHIKWLVASDAECTAQVDIGMQVREDVPVEVEV